MAPKNGIGTKVFSVESIDGRCESRGGSSGCEGLVASETDSKTISEIMHEAIADRVFPGGAVGFGCSSVPCYLQGYGTYTYESSVPVTPDSVFDLASLTKVLATTAAVMILYEKGLIELEEFACKYLPSFGENGKNKVTIRHLLTHTSGMREWYPFLKMGFTKRDEVVNFIVKDKLWYPVGGPARYSDLSMIVLGVIIERITGTGFSEFVDRSLYKPLGMRSTRFRQIQSSDFDPRVVPTEVDKVYRNRLLWGEVHDPTAYLLGGVSGNAGLFSSLSDVCVFAQMLLSGGIDLKTRRRFFRESTMRLFTTPGPSTIANPCPFALGWDVAVRTGTDGYTSAGDYTGPRTFGHTGYTGTSIWIDPDRNFFIVLLTNSVHPTADCGKHSMKMREVRPALANAAVLMFSEQAIPRVPVTWHLGALPHGMESYPYSRDWLSLPVAFQSRMAGAAVSGIRRKGRLTHGSRHSSLDKTFASLMVSGLHGHSVPSLMDLHYRHTYLEQQLYPVHFIQAVVFNSEDKGSPQTLPLDADDEHFCVRMASKSGRDCRTLAAAGGGGGPHITLPVGVACQAANKEIEEEENLMLPLDTDDEHFCLRVASETGEYCRGLQAGSASLGSSLLVATSEGDANTDMHTTLYPPASYEVLCEGIAFPNEEERKTTLLGSGGSVNSLEPATLAGTHVDAQRVQACSRDASSDNHSPLPVSSRGEEDSTVLACTSDFCTVASSPLHGSDFPASSLPAVDHDFAISSSPACQPAAPLTEHSQESPLACEDDSLVHQMARLEGSHESGSKLRSGTDPSLELREHKQEQSLPGCPSSIEQRKAATSHGSAQSSTQPSSGRNYESLAVRRNYPVDPQPTVQPASRGKSPLREEGLLTEHGEDGHADCARISLSEMLDASSSVMRQEVSAKVGQESNQEQLQASPKSIDLRRSGMISDAAAQLSTLTQDSSPRSVAWSSFSESFLMGECSGLRHRDEDEGDDGSLSPMKLSMNTNETSSTNGTNINETLSMNGSLSGGINTPIVQEASRRAKSDRFSNRRRLLRRDSWQVQLAGYVIVTCFILTFL